MMQLCRYFDSSRFNLKYVTTQLSSDLNIWYASIFLRAFHLRFDAGYYQECGNSVCCTWQFVACQLLHCRNNKHKGIKRIVFSPRPNQFELLLQHCNNKKTLKIWKWFKQTIAKFDHFFVALPHAWIRAFVASSKRFSSISSLIGVLLCSCLQCLHWKLKSVWWAITQKSKRGQDSEVYGVLLISEYKNNNELNSMTLN